MTYNYPFNIITKDYSELQIMPTDGRWDLIRCLKSQYSWRVQLWFPNNPVTLIRPPEPYTVSVTNTLNNIVSEIWL